MTQPNESTGEQPQNNEPELVESTTKEPVEEKSPLETLTAERDELRDLLLRTRAEMDNVRKRMTRERDEERKYSSLPVIRELLPVIDNLHRALEASQKDHNTEALLQGVQMVARQLEEVLTRQGLQTIPAVGQPFDPNLHEALQQVPTSEHPPMTVIQEYERGFQLHDRVVRPSKVIVSSAPAQA
ncbi:nucleotide exchange factor GrpE [Planctomicrobium sp. SH661]|uniref:nucleotide exchange factor GrpE n=1 Tax=Planctomicrobium sp. SH661 TaxID=3448124 RepID=UPI003F5B74C7